MGYTRKQYLAGECSHNEYYAQFVTSAVIETVKRHIGEDKIAASTDEYFNDIPLHQWDMLERAMRHTMDEKAFKALACPEAPSGQIYWSLCDAVCIAKQAARMIKENNNETRN